MIKPGRWQTLTTILATAAMLLVTLGGLYVGFLRQAGRPEDGGDQDWTTAQGNPARTGEATGPGPTGPLGALWRFQTGGRIATAPAIAGGVIYVGSDDHNLYALDSGTGALLWKRDLGAEVQSSPSVTAGLVFVVVENTLYALDAVTGRDRWTFADANRDTIPNVASGSVYLGTSDNRFAALDAKTGAGRWRTAPVKGILTRTTAFADGRLFATSLSGAVVAFDDSGAVIWQTQELGATSSPVVTGDSVYVASSSSIKALDVATGIERWSISYNPYDPPISSPMTNYPPVVAGDTLYQSDVQGTLNARDTTTGDLEWSFRTGGLLTALPTVANGVVYLASNDHVLYAIDAATGAERWRLLLDEAVDTGPSIAGGVAYVGTRAGTLYAIGSAATIAAPTVNPAEAPLYRGGPERSGTDAGTGPVGPPELRWRVPTIDASSSSPAVSGGIAYIGDRLGGFIALDLVTGAERWRFRTGPGNCVTPAVVDGVVYVACQDTHLYAVNAATGQLRWQYDAHISLEASPAVVDGVLYLGTDRRGKSGAVVAIDPGTGRERWRAAVVGDVAAAPAVVDGVVYAALWYGAGNQSGAESALVALHAKSGTQIWRHELTGAVYDAPAVVDGVVYLGSTDGVFAFEAASGDLRWQYAPDGDKRLVSAPAVAEGMIYASGGGSPNLYALDAATGRVRWQATVGMGDASGLSPATIAGGVVYVGGNRVVAAFDAVSGAELWRYSGDFAVNCPVTVVDGTVLFGATEPAGSGPVGNLITGPPPRGAVYALAAAGSTPTASPGGGATPT